MGMSEQDPPPHRRHGTPARCSQAKGVWNSAGRVLHVPDDESDVTAPSDRTGSIQVCGGCGGSGPVRREGTRDMCLT